MITHNISLSLSNAAIFLDIPLKELKTIVPKQYKRLSLQQIDAVGRRLSGRNGDGEDRRVVCLATPLDGWRNVFIKAIAPAVLPPEILDLIDFYLTEAPFVSSVIEVLHWLNQEGLHRQQSIHHIASELSRRDVFRLFEIFKGDKAYRKLYQKLMNPPPLRLPEPPECA